METPELPVVVGMNVSDYRTAANATLSDFSRHARRFGNAWSTGRVADIESGRGGVTLGTLVGLAATIESLLGSPISLADLITTEAEHIDLGRGFTIRTENLKAALSGEPVLYRAGDVPGGAEQAMEAMRASFAVWDEIPDGFGDVPIADLEAVEQGSGEAERQAAASLGVEPLLLTVASAKLWRRSLSAERDGRAGEGATAKQRGHVTRALKAELKAAIEAAKDGR